MNVYTRPIKSTTPRHFRDSKRWDASWTAAHPEENGTAVGPSTSTARRIVSGQFLARNKLSPRARAELAAGLLNGGVEITRLTAKQAAALCRVSVAYVNAVRRPQAVTAKELTLAETLAAATSEELARELGSHRLWEILEHATA